MNKPTIERLMKFSRDAATAKKTSEGGSDQHLVGGCADCLHWSGHEYPPAYDKAYCEIFDKDTAGNHGTRCAAFSSANK